MSCSNLSVGRGVLVWVKFAWVKQAVRVQGALDLLHHLDGTRSEFLNEILLLSDTDTVFTGAGSLKSDRSLDHSVHGS